MITFSLGRAKHPAIVDDIDFDLADLRWFNQDGYASRWNPVGTPRMLRLHTLVMGRILDRPLTQHEMVDHKNRNRADNRRENLRLTDRQTNGQNRPANRNSRSGYKGVSWFKAGKQWRADLNIKSKQINIGYFSNLRDAVIAYNHAALIHYGEFAYLNPVPEATPPVAVE